MRTDPALLERQVDVLSFLARLEEHIDGMTGVITQAFAPNGVLATELAVIRSDGTWTKDFQGRFAAVAVANHGGNAMTGTAGSAGSAAPTSGTGVFKVPSGAYALVNMADNVVTLYGTPGDTATVQVFVRPQTPFFSPGTPPGVQVSTSGTGTPTSVAAAVADTPLLAGNAARRGATIFNDSTANLYLALGFTASATQFTVKIPAGSYYEVPYSFVGAIRGYWDAANGNARITELS